MTGGDVQKSAGEEVAAVATASAAAQPLDYQGGAAARVETRPTNSAGEPLYFGLPAVAWVKICTITALFAAVFWPNLRRLWLKTNPISGEPNWGHAICVPIIGLYFLYIHREELLKTTVRPLLALNFSRNRFISAGALLFAGLCAYFVGPFVLSSQAENFRTLGQGFALWGILSLALDWGLGTTLFGLLLFGYGIWPGQNDFVKDFGMVVTLFGVVLMLTGWQVMKLAWFPIVFLICSIPWPGLVYSWVAGPLQNLAARVAVFVLQLTGVGAAQFGTKIQIGGFGSAVRTLNVAEACAGLRSLMTFITVAAAVAFLSARPLWQKIFLTITAVPIAIFCNVMRVSGQGILDYYVSNEWAEGFAHGFAGLVMLVPAFFLILLVGWILDHLFVEVADETADGDAGAPAAAKPRKPAAPTELVVEVPRRKSIVVTATSPPPELEAIVATIAPSAAPVAGKVAPPASVAPPPVKPAVPKPVAPLKPAAAPAAAKPSTPAAPVKTPAPTVAAAAKPPAPARAPAAPARAPATSAVPPAARPAANVPGAPPAARPAASMPSVPPASRPTPGAPRRMPSGGFVPPPPSTVLRPSGAIGAAGAPRPAPPKAPAPVASQNLKPPAASKPVAGPKPPAAAKAPAKPAEEKP